jgi:nitroimidazol reductase NimA-like FMN-containing flavoprotein (pyridoxamine 5'-phosphate oxidase superfamily)
MSSTGDIMSVIKSLSESQRFAVLAMDKQEQPYLFLMAFTVTCDLRTIILVTERDTYKYALLQSNQRVALLIDNRENMGADTQETVVVTALGVAEEVGGDEGKHLKELHMARHPYLEGFTKSPSCAIVRVRVRSYQVVRKFQEVVEWCIDPHL